MAKKKETPAELESRVEREIVEQFGEGLFRSGTDIISEKRDIISVSPALDVVLGGGILSGSWVICSGKAKVGKSSTALAFARNCQLLGRKVYYLDIEGRLKSLNLNGTKGLDPSKVNVIRSTKGRILTAEMWLIIAEKIIRDEPGCLLIFDSSSALCAESEMTADSNGQMRPIAPKLLAQFTRKLNNIVPVQDCIVWIVQHTYISQGKGAATTQEDGGVALQYQADYKIRAQYAERWEVGSGENARQIGQKIHWNMMTSALGGIPNSTCTSYLRYGTGLDRLQELLEAAGSLGIFIRKAGSWMSFDSEDGEKKVQGAEALYSHFAENPADYKRLEDHIRSVFGGLAST